jgi:shikimate dehydrogenase
MSVTPATKLYGVVGDPVAHSLSPLIHNRWMREAGIDAVYVALHLRSPDAAADLHALARAGFSGLNITLPHKVAALKAAASASPEARLVGAANTLSRESGSDWAAHNTDIEGFSLALSHALSGNPRGRRVVLIGAGGAARAVACALGQLGAELAIVNRTRSKAEALSKELAPPAETAELTQLNTLAERADIVVNSASLGHAGASLPQLPAGKGRPFLDLSYGKAAKESLAAAKAAGWAPHDGLRMLVGQAAAAFKIWFDISPDVPGALSACEAIVAVRR